MIVLRQNMREGWHTYWINPGDSGEPTQLTWRPAPGWTIGAIQWPTPDAIPFATLVNHGYSNEVLFPIEVTAPANARPGDSITLTADGYWLVCSNICIPEDGVVTVTVQIAAQGRDDRVWGPRIAAAVAALPRRHENVVARITEGAPAQLSVAMEGAEQIRNPRFFAFNRDAVSASAAQSPRVGPAGVTFSLTPNVADNLGEVLLEGVVAYEVRENGAWAKRGVEISAEPGEVIAGTSEAPARFSDDYLLADVERAGSPHDPAAFPLDAASLLVTLGLAFLGGLILNIMPCVLPVLSVKALAFAGGGGGDARKHGLFFFVGVMLTFLGLASLLIVLRGAGEAAGWGFQLQAPWVTSALALLFFAIGLNLLGVFEIGGGTQGLGAGLAQRGGSTGAFFTGVLAVVAATPCTAPFMAGAIGVAITQSALTTLLIFAALALGFAAPLTALHFAPGLQRIIPKPGPWMERAKNLLSFPMFAAAVWLAWVLAEQTGPMGVLALLSLAVALAFVLVVSRWGRLWLALGAAALVLTAAFTWRPLVGMQTQSVLASQPWSEARVEALREEGRGVFVNFTAAWCVTCKINERATLQSPRLAQAFAERGVVYLVADWTNRDEAIGAELAKHGRAGVPLYVYYPSQGEPIVLPQLLSEEVVLRTIEAAP